MADALELCFERLDAASPDEAFVRCTALPGRQQGLGLGGGARITWRDPAAALVCVTEDGKLALLRVEHAPVVAVERHGRRLEAPAGKPVLLRGGDLLSVDGQRLRLHLHGPTSSEVPPAVVPRWLLAAATALALGAASGVGFSGADGGPSKDGRIEVRDQPPCAPLAPRRP